jgi:hypothetical protein
VAWTQAVIEGKNCLGGGGRSDDGDCLIFTIATVLLHPASRITKTKVCPCFEHFLYFPPFAGFHVPVDPFHMRPVWEDVDSRRCDGDGDGDGDGDEDGKAKEELEWHVNQVDDAAAAAAAAARKQQFRHARS